MAIVGGGGLLRGLNSSGTEVYVTEAEGIIQGSCVFQPGPLEGSNFLFMLQKALLVSGGLSLPKEDICMYFP